jgi:signal transduction histidine kinase
MDLSRPSLRLLVLFAAAAIPPLVGLAILLAMAPEWVSQVGLGTALLIAAAAGAVWAGIVAIAGSRAIARDVRTLVELAERGSGSTPESELASEPFRRVASALEERNRQIARLADAVSAAPITSTARQVAASMVHMARQVTGDPTWELAVLRSSDESLLPPGIYTDDPEQPSAPLTDLHRWAAATGDDGASPSRHAIGPMGAFVVADASAGAELRAVVIALWEGRPDPTRAELDLFALIGQQAATAIDHALLFARVRNQAEELNRMAAIQSDFLRGVTHDLQTPLTSIRALASELGQTAGLDAGARADLDTIAHQAERLRRMVSQLLVASRLEVGAVTPHQEVFRAEPVIRRTWEALRADRRLELVNDGPEHLLVADEDRVEQVLWAVLDNAVKYSRPGSIVTVKQSAMTGDGGNGTIRSMIEIADEGIGIDAESVQHVFDQFYRSTDARRLAPDGSGVGLYAARGLVRAMGGDIQIASRLGRGSRVVIELPAEAAESEEDA